MSSNFMLAMEIIEKLSRMTPGQTMTITVGGESSAPPTGSTADETIERLRGQLQNCVNLLHRLKRHGYASDVQAADNAIESANRTLYETLCR